MLNQAILYSYRRCPYAMRARMALKHAGVAVEIREISLREKPAHMLQVSPKGTVPVLVLASGEVIEQSLDIMHWALKQPRVSADLNNGWLNVDLAIAQSLIAQNDGDFKSALDRYKYPERYPEKSQAEHRAQGEVFLQRLEELLQTHDYLLANHVSLADIAIFPFIRQFVAVDAAWFESAPYPKLCVWLKALTSSALFISIMEKQPTYIT